MEIHSVHCVAFQGDFFEDEFIDFFKYIKQYIIYSYDAYVLK